MAFRNVLRIFLDENILNKTEFPEQSVIVLIRVNHLIFDNHNEFVYLISESFGDLDS